MIPIGDIPQHGFSMQHVHQQLPLVARMIHQRVKDKLNHYFKHNFWQLAMLLMSSLLFLFSLRDVINILPEFVFDLAFRVLYFCEFFAFRVFGFFFVIGGFFLICLLICMIGIGIITVCFSTACKCVTDVGKIVYALLFYFIYQHFIQ